MSRSILRGCLQPGCPVLVQAGRCPTHERQREQAARGSSYERGYDRHWQRLRLVKLKADPICQIHTHCLEDPATEVDHIIPIVDWPDGRLRMENLQSTCKACHSAKTRRENA